MHTGDAPFVGRCSCDEIRFRMNRTPLFVHGCHCTLCQRQTGAAFAINALVETTAVEVLHGETEAVEVPTASGKGQWIVRCPSCRVALWSHYVRNTLAFVRVGTLDEPHRISPDVHIYTSTKHPCVQLPDGAVAVPEYYDAREHWPAESLERARAARR